MRGPGVGAGATPKGPWRARASRDRGAPRATHRTARCVKLAGVIALAPAALSCVLAATAPVPLRLQALTATSGAGAESLLDGDRRTGWRPEGDPEDEGVLFRFEAPTALDGIEVATCGGEVSLQAFVNGRAGDAFAGGAVPALFRFAAPGQGARVQSVFLKLLPGERAACLAEVRFVRNGAPVPVAAPRRVSGRVEPTSTLSPAAAYHASYLFDARLDFGWVEGAEGAGEGQAVTIALDAPLEVTALELWNGYQRSPVHFQKNARARKVTISVDGGPAIPFELKDVSGAQKLALPAPVKARRIRLGVESAYPGTKYADLVLSELRLWDASGPVGVAVADRAALRAALLAQVDGALAAALGRHLSNGCADPAGSTMRSLKLRADQTFAIYEETCDQMGEACTSEVFDGTWVPIARSGAWTELELFGRRHRVDHAWDPYADAGPRVKETDTIAGGRVRIAALRDLSPREQDELRQAGAVGGVPVAACIDLGADPSRDAVIVRGPPLTDAFFLPVAAAGARKAE